ncbi:MAG: hypothetical protein IPL61_03585 [Myxococcales bacterium]|nr:hypothetical protein [Myxococcales bacterium]
MRTMIVLAALLAPATALADNDYAAAVAGTFDVKYEEVTSNCQNTGIVLNRGAIEISKRRGATINVDIDRMPMMAGTASKGGRLKASSKIGKTSIQGLDGRFSTAGTVNGEGDNAVLNVVFVAEYYLKGKAYCTQSWNVTGVRKVAAPTPAPKAQAQAQMEQELFEPWTLGRPLP